LERTIASSLCRYRVTDEHLISDELIKAEIAKAFDNNRCFEFYMDKSILERIKAGDPIEIYREKLINIRKDIFNKVSKDDKTVSARLISDSRLSSRLIAAMSFIHRAAAECEFKTVFDRRFVLVKENPGVPTIFHLSNDTTVIAHVGQGPPWAEIPTIYLGLKTFDALYAEQKKGNDRLFKAFKLLLMIEERAIETGYTHAAVYPSDVSLAISYLVDEIIKNASQFRIDEEPEIPEKKKVRKFTEINRKTYLKDLNARIKKDELNFDYNKNLKSIKSLERLASRYKKSDDINSLREIVRILIAASGHDIHEIRNRANIILERIFAPKEFDAPLARNFINLNVGGSYNFKFELHGKSKNYFLRIYKNSTEKEFFLEQDIEFDDIPLELDRDKKIYTAEYQFKSYGHYDFLVFREKQKKSEWIKDPGTSGRVNVIPDVKGEIILEIFTDIHGHTKYYWKDESNHPGLIYNENGEIIRLGKFSDISAHLEDLKKRYYITAIYLLGAQKRGENREDWAFEASSPSPFSPLSLIDIEESLGGEKDFIELINKAHSLGIKIIIDIIPHINRLSSHLSDDLVVMTYDDSGNIIPRASTDGRYGSWNDGKLLNYRKLEIWEWLADSINTLIEKYDIDGIRFDSAHAVPIMMKKNNFLYRYDVKRTDEELVDGTIIVNEREDDHYITTSYYDCSCRDLIAVPLHYFLVLNIERELKKLGKKFFIYIAECYWGHERFLARTGIIPYNSSLFKICENIIHGKTDVREIYHIYDNYFPNTLPEGTELLGIIGNHDERRALNTFGHRGLRPAIALTIFMSDIILDYEGSAEGEGWKVFLDNIYVNWNQFEYAAHRSLEGFYKEWYSFHQKWKGKGHLVWANNNQVAAALKFTESVVWIGIFNFAESNQAASLQFDNPDLPLHDDVFYRLSDPLYSNITGKYSYYKGSELKISRINTIVSYTDRVKLLKLEIVDLKKDYHNFLKDSLLRLCEMSNVEYINSNFLYSEIAEKRNNFESIISYIKDNLVPLFWEKQRNYLELGLKRSIFFLFKNKLLDGNNILEYAGRMIKEKDAAISNLGKSLIAHNERGSIVFMSAEAYPFSKSGGLANVVYELPKELVGLNEEVYVITGYYKYGDEKAVKMMQESVKKYNVEYTGKNVSFKIMDYEYTVGVHYANVNGVNYYLLEHYEFFDGLYWGVTSAEKIRRRVAFARACADVIIAFDLSPHYTFTNDAFAGIFNGIVKCDSYYMNNPNFIKNTFLHIIHNGGWQYFDAYNRHENGFDLFNLFNLPTWCGDNFTDPVFRDRLSCMATGVKFADRTITVSPSYAKQIEYASDGLENILYNVIGISNAIGKDFKKNAGEYLIKSDFIIDNYQLLIEHIKKNKGLKYKIERRYPDREI